MTISGYLSKLSELRGSLEASLRAKGIACATGERLDTLVPKVDEISTVNGLGISIVNASYIEDGIYGEVEVE